MQTDLAAHLLNQAVGDGQAEAGATELPGHTAIGLDEGLENLLLMGGIDADAGVTDGELHAVQACGRQGPLDPQAHLAGGRELDGIADQVDQDLAEPTPVTKHPVRHIGGHLPLQPDALDDGLGLQELALFVQHAVQRERGRVQLQAAGLDLGQVEQVVDQLEQVVP